MAISPAARRNAAIMGLVCSGHAMSHFYGLTLPPLFPVLKEEFGVSYAALGLLVTLFNVATACVQIPVGFLTDRIGARRVLFGGLFVMGAAMALVGTAPSYGWVVALVMLAGAANSVFHPSDYAILSASIPPSWQARAYGVHTFSGTLGFVAAPGTMVFLTALYGWRTAMMIAGGISLAVLAVMLVCGRVLKDEGGGADRARKGGAEPIGLRALLTPQVIVLFCFFAMLTMAGGGLQSFAVTAMVDFHGVGLGTANSVLTAYLIGSSAGILLGGQISDSTSRHGLLAAVSMMAVAVLLFLIGAMTMPTAILFAAFGTVGILQGVVRPARDMMVKAATPPGATGRVFGFVTMGINVGSAVTPVIFGWLIDIGQSRWVFLAAGAIMLAAIATVGVVRGGRARPTREAAAE